MAAHIDENALSRQKLLSEDTLAQIDQFLAKYPEDRRQSAVMPSLRVAQEANGGWLTVPIMDEIAAYLKIPPIAVYEVASFYSMYEHKPVGRHKICVCTNISCLLCGSEEIVAHLEKKLGIKMGDTTDDGRITLKEVECLGACVGAPMFQIGTDYYEHLTPEKIDSILDQLD
ncbi:MAG: NADH-quinone oxidoreductase subunit NuoE [Gammaproteobacteria bacterium]|nr:NADH-quinone oxidoreductase subunit NuoE [Gammaproteobacteria bacterium]MDH5800475.1 NADH-quinone oxidoreductase subunit NuoE [Gammaproteobacteria bacterium]